MRRQLQLQQQLSNRKDTGNREVGNAGATRHAGEAGAGTSTSTSSGGSSDGCARIRCWDGDCGRAVVATVDGPPYRTEGRFL